MPARKIVIEGSHDNATWEPIRQGIGAYSFYYEVTQRYFERYTNEVYEGYAFGSFSREKLSVSFPEARFQYVRVRVPHDMDKEPVALKGMEIYRVSRTEAEEERFEAKVLSIQLGEEEKSTDSIVDFGAKNLRLSRIEINTPQTNFFRRVRVAGSDDRKEWTALAEGVIFSISLDQDEEKDTTVKLNKSPYRYLRIRVFNGDNKPLKIDSVTGYGLKKFLVIMPEKGREYTLLYGNPAAKAVHYDLGRLVSGKAVDVFAKGELGKQSRNEHYEPYKEPEPWTENKQVLWTAMLVIIIGLLFLGSRVIKKVNN